jgi:hypothetical protein
MLKALLLQKDEIAARIALMNEEHALRMAPLNDEMTAVNSQISEATADKLKQLRDLSGKEFGVLHLTIDGIKVSQTVAKKVTWDQTILNDLFKKIEAAGDEPRNYMKLELKIGEKEYDKFAPGIKTIFAEARTVTPGAPTIKFEEVADA